MFHINGQKCENLYLFCNYVKQNIVFLDKMFHVKGTRWRLVPYIILEGRSPDRSQSIKKDRSDAALFAYGGEGTKPDSWFGSIFRCQSISPQLLQACGSSILVYKSIDLVKEINFFS